MTATARRSVVVVDDTAANLHLLTELLGREDFAVRVAPDGVLALRAVDINPPDLILLDIRMPGIDGIEVCRRLKANPRTAGIPIIFLSALQETEDKLRSFAAGGVDYITKPFVAEEVVARVRSHLALRTLELHLEERVREQTRALRCLSAGNHALVHARSAPELLDRMCRAVVEAGGYAGARVTLADGGCAGAGTADGAEILALPLMYSGVALGGVEITATAPFSDEERALLEELAGDLGFGLVTLRGREALERALESTIHAVAATIEARDPYTAGHQRRVAELAVRIGRAMGLDDYRVKGVYVAGLVHDIGKISVPAEILGRPGPLSPAEFALIKEHSVTGYRILRGIEFPWPVAQTVLQHHERLDGSGYPQGLTADAILMESRILTVADVIEAIASHRPYRPALGLAVALSEIKRGRGVRYDADAVDACCALAESGALEPALLL